MTPDREQIISRAMLDAENRHGNASEQFAVGKEVEAVSLGDRAAAHIWQTVAERLHTLHDIGRPLGARTKKLIMRRCQSDKLIANRHDADAIDCTRRSVRPRNRCRAQIL